MPRVQMWIQVDTVSEAVITNTVVAIETVIIEGIYSLENFFTHIIQNKNYIQNFLKSLSISYCTEPWKNMIYCS